jgi:hypothetical protein
MAANIRWGLVVFVVLVGSKGLAEGVDIEPLVIGGSEYRAENVQVKTDSPLEAWVKAVDLQSSAEVWRVRLYEGTSRPAWVGGVKNPKVVSLAAFAHGLIAKTDDGATFFVDSTSHKAELVRDLRRNEATCPVHHRPLVGVFAPIHYGLVRANSLPVDQREKYPQADRPIEGGCCVMPEKTAIVTYCPDCR